MNRFFLAGFLLLAGCVSPVNYERPPVELPEAWKESAPRYARTVEAMQLRWTLRTETDEYREITGFVREDGAKTTE